MQTVLRAIASAIAAAAVAACVTATPDHAPALWRIDDGAERMWLFGSIHALPPQTRWLTTQTYAALLDADRLVVENDVRAEPRSNFGRLLTERAKLPAGASLTDFFAAEDYSRIEAFAAAWDVDLAPFAHVAPWRVLYRLTSREPEIAGASYRLGADARLFILGVSQGKEILGLESSIEQADAVAAGYASIGLERQARALLDYVDAGVDANIAAYQALVEAWRGGDAALFEASVREDLRLDPELYRAFIAQRNDSWMAQIAPLVDDGKNDFVAVGVAHLYGPDGLIAQLEARGYTVTRIQ